MLYMTITSPQNPRSIAWAYLLALLKTCIRKRQHIISRTNQRYAPQIWPQINISHYVKTNCMIALPPTKILRTPQSQHWMACRSDGQGNAHGLRQSTTPYIGSQYHDRSTNITFDSA